MSQVAAGHGNVVVAKDYIIKKMDNVEVDFSKKLQVLQKGNPELQKIMPRVIEINGNEIKMSKVGQGLEDAKTCDVKIGFRTFSRQVYFTNRHIISPKKELKMAFQDRLKGSKLNGFRIEGFTDESKVNVYLNPQKKLEEFLGKDIALYQSAIDQLKNIRGTIEKQDFALIGSSVLFALDKNKKNIDLKLIDFAHPFYKSMDERKYEKIQTSFLGGMDNLISNIESFKEKLIKKENLIKQENQVDKTTEKNQKTMEESKKLTEESKKLTEESKKSTEERLKIVVNMDWNYKSDDFQLKINDLGKPDIEEQNKSNARIWFHTLFSELSPDNNKFNIQSGKVLKTQQEILLRNICAMAVSVPQSGEQNPWNFKADNSHSIAQLISGGGRFGYVFEDENIGKKFTNFLVSGDENRPFQELINQRLDAKGKKVPIEKNYEDGKSKGEEFNNKSHGEMYKRISTHSQRLVDGHFKEVKHFASGVGDTYGMNFPIGGVGNIIDGKEKTMISYEGESENGKYQLGTMLLKFDSQEGQARLMCGLESTAPMRKNQLGNEHGVLSTIEKNSKRFFQVMTEKLKLPFDSHKLLAQSRSLTGQCKGYQFGTFTSYGSNMATVTAEKLEKFQGLYTALKNMDMDSQKTFVKEILLSTNEKDREKIYQSAIQYGIKKEDLNNSNRVKSSTSNITSKDSSFLKNSNFLHKIKGNSDRTMVVKEDRSI